MEVENVTLGRHIDRLEEAGWVERRRDPADRRAWRLYLDEKARPIIDRLSVLSRGVREEALAGIPPDECEHLIDTLIHIKDNLLTKETAVGEEPVRAELRTAIRKRNVGRSEEHTSELQSLMRTSYPVYCLTKTTKRT